MAKSLFPKVIYHLEELETPFRTIEEIKQWMDEGELEKEVIGVYELKEVVTANYKKQVTLETK